MHRRWAHRNDPTTQDVNPLGKGHGAFFGLDQDVHPVCFQPDGLEDGPCSFHSFHGPAVSLEMTARPLRAGDHKRTVGEFLEGSQKVNGIKPPAARQREETETLAIALFQRLSLFQAARWDVLAKKERQGAILKLVHWLPLFSVASSLKRRALKSEYSDCEQSERVLPHHGPIIAALSKVREVWRSYLTVGEKKQAPFRLKPVKRRLCHPLSVSVRHCAANQNIRFTTGNVKKKFPVWPQSTKRQSNGGAEGQ
jgi:hypothetical protein